MKAVTTEQMRELDRRTIAAGTPGEELMERAGFAVAKAAIEFLKRRDSRKALLFAGKGNNGGDAVVAARHLQAAGCAPTLIRIEDWPCKLPEAAVIVDGLLGIGLKGEVREPFASAIKAINESKLPVVAIDVPSGLGTGICVRADVTVTMGLPKIDLLKYPDVVGRIEVADIGVGDDVETDVELITRRDVELPARKRSAHKGDFGHLLIVAGSEGYTGAPVLCAHAAARAGAGLVTLAVPKEIYPIVAGKCPPEIMPRALDDLPKHDALAIGPGMGQKPETQKLIWKLLSSSTVPAVVDADALNALATAPSAIKKLPGPLVLTPHPGEMARLTGRRVEDRWAEARKFADEFGHVLVLKGAGTVVTENAGSPRSERGKLWINSTGNPGMAKGGMGDTLTGIIGALLAQRMTPLEAAKAGVFWHGLAGDFAVEKYGVASMLATDLIEALGPAWHIRAATF
jgi:ADP-dependent NAD(P)H-hydrate dehydratase / NAD(P)H-hydrate epimerase